MVMFGWGASVFYHLRRPPDEAMHIYAVGKQWMWKFQHLEGQREINELHIPAGRPIKITISSEDVLHSLYFPAFRTKMDAIPGRYTELWFEATTPGTYHIFCTEYCGTNHSGMIGSVTVLEPAQYQTWLQGGGDGGHAGAARRQAVREPGLRQLPPRQRPGPRSVAERHRRHDRGRCRTVSTVVVDDAYLRESILTSQAKIVKGFQPLMPTFQGLISEENCVALIEHVKSHVAERDDGGAGGAPRLRPTSTARAAGEKK